MCMGLKTKMKTNTRTLTNPKCGKMRVALVGFGIEVSFLMKVLKHETR